MQIQVNGKSKTLDEPTTLRQLIEHLGLGSAAVAAEINKELVPSRDHESTTLSDGDMIELVTLVGGG